MLTFSSIVFVVFLCLIILTWRLFLTFFCGEIKLVIYNVQRLHFCKCHLWYNLLTLFYEVSAHRIYDVRWQVARSYSCSAPWTSHCTDYYVTPHYCALCHVKSIRYHHHHHHPIFRPRARLSDTDVRTAGSHYITSMVNNSTMVEERMVNALPFLHHDPSNQSAKRRFCPRTWAYRI